MHGRSRPFRTFFAWLPVIAVPILALFSNQILQFLGDLTPGVDQSATILTPVGTAGEAEHSISLPADLPNGAQSLEPPGSSAAVSAVPPAQEAGPGAASQPPNPFAAAPAPPHERGIVLQEGQAGAAAAAAPEMRTNSAPEPWNLDPREELVRAQGESAVELLTTRSEPGPLELASHEQPLVDRALPPEAYGDYFPADPAAPDYREGAAVAVAMTEQAIEPTASQGGPPAAAPQAGDPAATYPGAAHEPPRLTVGDDATLLRAAAIDPAPTPLTWEAAQALLQELGVTSFRLETAGDTDRFRFSCTVPAAEGDYLQRHFQAEAPTAMEAVRSVIREIAYWQSDNRAGR